MPINRETLNKRLYKALRRYDAKPVDDTDEVIPLEDEADAFRFNFTKDGENYGLVYATLDDTKSLTIWFDDTIMDSPSRPTPGMDYNDTFTGFLKYMKKWALDNQLTFGTDNRNHLGNEMARRKRMKEKEKISEGYYPIGKKASYSDAVPNVKIILQHTKVMQEGEQRFRHIEKIFVENTQGERFLVPTTKPGLARVFARHIAEGGTPYDERAGHIQSLVEEYSKMAGFVRATRNGQFNESAQKLVSEGVNHYIKLRESLSKMTGHRGYTAYFENWTPALMEDDTDNSNINELFVQETLDPRIESVMPILSRLHKQVSEMKEVDALSEWADEIISEKMVMGADSDASASGTVFVEDDIDEATDLTSIPDESVEEGSPGLWANIHAKRARGEKMRKPGSKGAPTKQDFKNASQTDEGLGDVAKKVGGAIKKAAGKAMDVVAPGDEELLRRLQKSAGIQAQHGKPNMAKTNEEEIEESGLQYSIGVKKHGKDYMTKAAELMRNGGTQQELGALKDRLSKAHKSKVKNEDVAEAAKWRQGYRASGHPPGYQHKSGEIGPLGGTYDTTSNYGDEVKVPVNRYRDEPDRLADREKTKISTSGKPLTAKNAARNLKTAIGQAKGKHGPVGVLPEQGVAEDLDANQKRVGQLGPTEKVKNNNIGKLVGANENFINMAPQAVAEGQEELEDLKRLLGEGWKGELAGGTIGGTAGAMAGNAIAGPVGGVVGGALGGTAGGMIGRELTKEEQIDEIAPLVGAGIAAGARTLVPLLSKIGPALGRMASSAGKAAAPVAQKGAQAAAQTAGQATRAGAEIAAKNAVPIGIGAGAYSAITDLAQGITGGVGEVYGDVKSAAAAIGGKLGDAVDNNTIMALAAAAVKYALPIGILLALVYGGKKLIDKVMSEGANDTVTGLAGQAVGYVTPNPKDFVQGFKQQFEGVNEGQEDLDAILRIIRK